MNTKFFFLLLVSLLIANATSSIVNTKDNTDYTEAEGTSTKKGTSKDESPKEEIPMPTEPARHTSHGEKVHRPNSDDDGKHHHFHFNRITARKGRKWFLVFISKMILAVAHICCLIYCFLHATHL